MVKKDFAFGTEEKETNLKRNKVSDFFIMEEDSR